FLTAVMPRALAALAQRETERLESTSVRQVEDRDATTLTWLRCRGGALTHWLQVENIDLEEEAFRQQWEQATNPALEVNDGDTAGPRLRLHGAPAHIEMAAAVAADPVYAPLASRAQTGLR